jgi:hypothetical protein
MSIYVVPALNAVDFALTSFTPADTTPYEVGLTPYTVPALNAVDFALVTYTLPTFVAIDWELLPGGFPTQYAGLRCFYGGTVKELCLVAEADAPSGMGGVLKVDKNGTTYAVYLVDTSDGDASSVRINTSTGVKAIRLKT